MKKTLIAIFAVVMAMTLSVSVFAVGGFISSPSAKTAPELINGVIVGCDGEIVITGYADRDELDDDARNEFEASYDDIASNKDLSNICEELKDLADKLGIDVEDLAVSDLFYVSYIGCDDHEGHDKFTVTLRPDTLNNFAALMAYVDGEWVLIENVKIENGTLTFDGEHYGPYAIVLNTAASPATGDSFPWIYLVLMGISAVGLVSVLVALKKKA